MASNIMTIQVRLLPDDETMEIILKTLNLWQDAHPGQMVAMVPAKDKYKYEIIPIGRMESHE